MFIFTEFYSSKAKPVKKSRIIVKSDLLKVDWLTFRLINTNLSILIVR